MKEYCRPEISLNISHHWPIYEDKSQLVSQDQDAFAGTYEPGIWLTGSHPPLTTNEKNNTRRSSWSPIQQMYLE